MVAILPLISVAIAFLELFYLGWTSDKHSSLAMHPEGEQLSPGFRGLPGNYFQNKDKLWLHYTADYAKIPKANVFIVHGLGGSKFGELTRLLVDNGFNVFAYDYQGWGKSEGDSKHMGPEGLRNGFADFHDFTKYILSKDLQAQATKTTFCFGKSMGGVHVLHAALADGLCQDGIVLAAPAIHPTVAIDETKMSVLRQLSRFLPKLPAVWKEGKLSLRARTAYTMVDYIFNDLPSLLSKGTQLPPYFLLQGGADTVTDPAAADNLHKKMKKELDKYKVYPTYDHSLEDEKQVQQDVVEWLTSAVKTKQN